MTLHFHKKYSFFFLFLVQAYASILFMPELLLYIITDLHKTFKFKNNVKGFYFQNKDYIYVYIIRNMQILLLGSISLEFRFLLPDYCVETLKENGTLGGARFLDLFMYYL